MGRLFWKFFAFCWLMQALAVFSVGVVIRLEHVPPLLPGAHDRVPIEPMIAGLLTSLICALWMAWYFSKPIRSLRQAFAMTAAGNLDFRLVAEMGKRSDALADLGRDFDLMATQLKTLVESQRRLLHDVSHELRSPLARLQVAIGLAHQQPAKVNDSLARIELESQRMEYLVSQLLTLSRLEVGNVGIREDVQMEELLAGLLSDAQFEAEAVGVSVMLGGDVGGVVNGNPELLRRAIENVVRNAIKHSPSDTSVKIWVDRKNALQRGTPSLVVTVCDQGSGVAEENLENIFSPFFREPTTKAGYGLGLTIAKRVIEAHGGTIQARNRVGAGLCVEMMLPVMPMP